MIDTEISGDPANIGAWAAWLRNDLKSGLVEASDYTVKGRKVARDGWHGNGGRAYLAYNRVVVSATDDHVDRVARGATVLEDLAARLTRAESAMAALRTRATKGGLTVTGSKIAEPADGDYTLYNTLADEATTTRDNYEAWVESNLRPAVTDAEDDDDLRKLVKLIKAQYPALAESTGVGLVALAKLLSDKRTSFIRKGRWSGDPRIRGQHKTAEGRKYTDSLKRKSGFLDKLGKIFRRLGLPLTIGAGIWEGITTGDWVKPVLTIAGGIAVASLVTAAFPSLSALTSGLLVVGAPVATSILIGHIYDKLEVRDRLGELRDRVADRWDDVRGTLEQGWDKVTPW